MARMLTSWATMVVEVVRNLDKTTISKLVRPPRKVDFSWSGTGIKDHLTPEDWASLDRAVTEALDQKNDRALAIVCASMVEDRLRWTLESYFVSDLAASKKRELFEGAGPLQSFKAKSDLAFALGLIRSDFLKQLNLIAQIRNKFAHNFRGLRFSDSKISPLCKQLEQFEEFEKKGMASSNEDLMKLFGLNCFMAATALLAIGNIVLAQREQPATATQPESDRSETAFR